MRAITAAVVACAGASAALAQPFYARGDFNGWSLANPMTHLGGEHYTVTVPGLTPGQAYEYKLADEFWTFSVPGSNGKIVGDAAGEVTFHLYNMSSWSDGWKPDNVARAGYEDSQMFDWEIMGSFNGWSAPVVALTDNGGGYHSAVYVVPTPGTYEFKFRKQGDWGISIGGDFGNAAGNIELTTTTPNEPILFELDLPGGRWRTSVVPAPGAAALLALAGLTATRRRR